MSGKRSLRTYIVEDNPTIRENLVATLEELGGIAPVGFAETEEQGSVWLTSHGAQWDLAIVDLFLKQGSGLGVLQACAAPGARGGKPTWTMCRSNPSSDSGEGSRRS